MFVFWWNAPVLINAVGVCWPAYKSFKALKASDAPAVDGLLTYWVVFAVFKLLEFVADIFICYLPLYYDLKLAFVVYLVLPGHAEQLYRKRILPFFEKHEAKVDGCINDAWQRVSELRWQDVQPLVLWAKTQLLGVAIPLVASMQATTSTTREPVPAPPAEKPTATGTGTTFSDEIPSAEVKAEGVRKRVKEEADGGLTVD